MSIWNFFKKEKNTPEIISEKQLFDDLKKLYSDVKDELNIISKLKQIIILIKNHLDFEKLDRRDMDLLLHTEQILESYLQIENKIEDRFDKIDHIQREVADKIGIDVSDYNEKIHKMIDNIVIDYNKNNIYGTPYQQKMSRLEINQLHEEVEKTKKELIPLVNDLETYQKKHIEQNMNEIIDFEKKLNQKLKLIFNKAQNIKDAKQSFSGDDLQEIKKTAKEAYELCHLTEAFLNGVEATLRSYVSKVIDFEKTLKVLIDTSNKKLAVHEENKKRLEEIRKNIPKRAI
jgi:hypothetical protein